jgi:DNA-binding PadR family transcriptional regulator
MERARTLGFEKMNPGTMYRALRQMEKDGDVESSWETSRGGAARRMYTITDAGEAHLGFWARSWGNTSSPWTPFSGSMRVSRRTRTGTRLASLGVRRP